MIILFCVLQADGDAESGAHGLLNVSGAVAVADDEHPVRDPGKLHRFLRQRLRADAHQHVAAGDLVLFALPVGVIDAVRVDGIDGDAALEAEARLVPPVVVHHVLVMGVGRVGDELVPTGQNGDLPAELAEV